MVTIQENLEATQKELTELRKTHKESDPEIQRLKSEIIALESSIAYSKAKEPGANGYNNQSGNLSGMPKTKWHM